eukprot:COSAG02_NODE_2743_length_8115_cov_5.631487_3_plen_126_part_00
MFNKILVESTINCEVAWCNIAYHHHQTVNLATFLLFECNFRLNGSNYDVRIVRTYRDILTRDVVHSNSRAISALPCADLTHHARLEHRRLQYCSASQWIGSRSKPTNWESVRAWVATADGGYLDT